MKNKGAILLVEEDNDDVVMVSSIIKDLGYDHELVPFENLQEAFEYVSTGDEKPFLIICNDNFRNKNNETLSELFDKYPDFKARSIPFVFYSSSIQEKIVNTAFKELNVQGYFQKGINFSEIRKELKIIIDYWETSLHPEL